MSDPSELEQVKNILIGFIEEFSLVIDDYSKTNGELTCDANQWICIENSLRTVVAQINGLKKEDLRR